MGRNDADARGWGTGWPNCQPGKIKTLTRTDGLRLPVRAEILPLVAWLLDETERRGYDVRPGETWGYACRPIRGSTVASNHSWGLAVDINAPANPMLNGSPGWQWLHDHGRTDMPPWLPDLWISHGFYWGGNYAHRQDAMHMEFVLTPADAARIIDGLHGTPTQAPSLTWIPVTAGMRDGTGPLVDAYAHEVAEVQLILAALGHDPGPADGIYGPRSQAATTAFKVEQIALQKMTGQPVWPNTDATVGPLTIGALRFWNAHRAAPKG